MYTNLRNILPGNQPHFILLHVLSRPSLTLSTFLKTYHKDRVDCYVLYCREVGWIQNVHLV